MSQNFDLLNQIEAEYRPTKDAPSIIPRLTNGSERSLEDPPNEELLRMAQAVFLSGDATTPHVVLICGVDQENGSSQICRELGRILALCSNQPVCLVDGDVRAHRLSKTFDLDGFGTRSASPREGCAERAPSLWLAARNVLDPKDDGVLAPASTLRQTIADLRNAFEFVLIDAPSVNVHGDHAVLGQIADAAILVLEADRTRRIVARKAKEVLSRSGVRLLGTVLNNRTFPIPEALYKHL